MGEWECSDGQLEDFGRGHAILRLLKRTVCDGRDCDGENMW
jgi:hypothetical protein